VRLPKDANRIAKGLKKKFTERRILRITGRLRGYERERLEKHEVFKRFGPPAEGDPAGGVMETVFLVGTAAAEVGLDADAAAIVCDFASLPTLLQRLGRLDRRGYLSRRFVAGECDAPTLTIFAKREKTELDIQARVLRLAEELRAEKADLPASLLVGTCWKEATAKVGGHERQEAEDEPPEEGDKKGKDIDPRRIVDAATWDVLLGPRQQGSSGPKVSAELPSKWLKHRASCVTGGPVAVPPLTTSLVEQWSATTDPRNAFLPVHPFLYGILRDEKETPLVSVAFRLEMDALAAAPVDEEEDEQEGQAVETQVKEVFRRFPPRRAEFHFVSLAGAREWFSSAEASTIPVALFDGGQWSVTSDHKESRLLRPGMIMILPTLAGSRASLSKLLEDANDPKEVEAASRDVLEGVSTQRPLYWRRVVQVEPGDHRLTSADGASRIEQADTAEESHAVGDGVTVGEPPVGVTWEPRLRYPFKIGTGRFRFEYLKPKRQVQPQLLDEHLERAEEEAGRIAEALAPGNEYLRSLLMEAAEMHDEGKRNPKWQGAMGNTDMANPVAKPRTKRPSSTAGFRHEWESLLKMGTPGIPDSLPEPGVQQWFDLWRHVVASHHGHLRPWLADRVLRAQAFGKQKQCVLRLASAERFVRLQRLLGPWRLAYLEALLKAVDVAAGPTDEQEEIDEQ
jgi:CRISPR-associated helicase Cas3